ncbi:MAG: hypothetical protein AAGB51_00265 [Planctomycetota bacterium]
MTSAQTMLTALLGALLAMFIAGCGMPKGFTAPSVHTAPYDASQGEVLWAVAPLRNESGLAQVDTLAVADEIVASVQQTRGVRCLPVNRVIAAMRALQIQSIEGPEQAQVLAGALGVDGMIVGTVTAYDPYTPVLGVSLALYARPGPLFFEQREGVDSRWLTGQPLEHTFLPNSGFQNGPASVVSLHLDAENHQTQLEVQRYARGRVEETSPYGWQRYTVSMALYTKFAAHTAVGRLLEREWLRFARLEAQGLGQGG